MVTVRTYFNFDTLDEAIAKIKELGLTSYTLEQWSATTPTPPVDEPTSVSNDDGATSSTPSVVPTEGDTSGGA